MGTRTRRKLDKKISRPSLPLSFIVSPNPVNSRFSLYCRSIQKLRFQQLKS
jgi:hypothetical protein